MHMLKDAMLSDLTLLHSDMLDREAASLTFKVLSRSGAAIFSLVENQLAVTTYALLELLKEPWRAPFIHQQWRQSPCRFDEFSTAFLQEFPTADQMVGEAARMQLLVAAHFSWPSTMMLESLNSSVQKVARKASILRVVPELRQVDEVVVVNSLSKLPKLVAACAATEHAAVQTARKRHTKPKGSWAWRAFISMRTAGQKGRADFRALSVEFRNLPEEELAEFQMLGDLARLRKRVAGQKLPLGVNPDTRACHGEIVPAENLNALVEPIKSVRRQAKLRRDKRRREADAVKSYKLNPERIQAAKKAMAKLTSEHVEHTAPTAAACSLPADKQFCWDFNPLPLINGVLNSKQRDVSIARLKQEWASIHEEVKSAAPLQPVHFTWSCRNAGRCLCSPQGQQLRQMEAELTRLCKKLFLPNSASKAKLESGDCIFGFCRDPDADISSFYHVAMLYQQPVWNPTFLALGEVSVNGNGTTSMQACSSDCRLTFLSIWDLLARLGTHRKWCMAVFEIVSTGERLDHIIPGNLLAVEMIAPRPFWDVAAGSIIDGDDMDDGGHEGDAIEDDVDEALAAICDELGVLEGHDSDAGSEQNNVSSDSKQNSDSDSDSDYKSSGSSGSSTSSSSSSSSRSRVPGAAAERMPQVFLKLERGTLHFQPQNNAVYARCPVCGARRTRTCNSSAARPSQGRPLGMLAAWLDAFQCDGQKAEHNLFYPSLAARQAHRRLLAADPESQLFFSLERKLADGEDSEPEDA